jgi:uncharacterized protein YdaU (DUF1376 family)
MQDGPAYQMYAQDFDMDTASWSNEEVGIYQRLLNYSWVNGGLPSDTLELSRIVREKRLKFEKIFIKNISKKWTENGNGKLINKKQEEVRETQRKYRESQVQKGKLSAKKRWGDKITGVIHPVTSGLQPKSNSSSSSSSSLNNKRSISHSEVKKFLTHYGERFKFYFGIEPVIEWGKDGTLIKNLLKIISFEELKELLELFFCSEDKFILKSGYTIGVFKSQINKLKIGDPLDGEALWLKTKEIQDERRRQKEIQLIDEKAKGNISDKSGR